MDYLPSETHKTLYKKISGMVADGKSYLEIAKLLLPNVSPYTAKGIIYRAHKKNSWTKDNEIRMMLGLPRFIFVQDNPTMKPAPICTACGQVHSIDRACEKHIIIKKIQEPRCRKWQDISTKELKWALENRHKPRWSMQIHHQIEPITARERE